MKKLALALTIFTLSSRGYAAPLLNTDDEKILLRTIDNICGDTWCEGDSNWSFDRLSCDSVSGCALELTMKPYEYSEGKALPPRPLTCQLPAFVTKSSLFDGTGDNAQYSPELYDAVSACINNLEERFGPMYVPNASSCPSLFDNSKAASIFTAEGLNDARGIWGAIGAVSSLIVERSKFDKLCTLDADPYFRDEAICQKSESSGEVCALPGASGSYLVLRNAATSARVAYFPKR